MKIRKLILGILFSTIIWFSYCSSETNAKKEDAVKEDKTEESGTATNEKGGVIVLNNADFKKLVHNYEANPDWKFLGNKPCIVDFYADWCKPCKMIAPIMEELSIKYAGKVNFYKVDVDAETALSSAFNIQSIPAVLFCPADGAQPQFSVGSMAKEDYIKAINDILKVN